MITTIPGAPDFLLVLPTIALAILEGLLGLIEPGRELGFGGIEMLFLRIFEAFLTCTRLVIPRIVIETDELLLSI